MKKIKLRHKLLFLLCATLICVAAGGGVYYGSRLYKRYEQKKTQALHSLVMNEISNCAELTVMKYQYGEVISLRKSGVFGLAKSYSLVRFTGVVRAGLPDISLVTVTISPDRLSVLARVPASSIISNDIVAQEVFDEVQSIFVPISTAEVFSEIDRVRIAQELRLKNSGFLADATRRSEELITRILSAMGFESVTVHSF